MKARYIIIAFLLIAFVAIQVLMNALQAPATGQLAVLQLEDSTVSYVTATRLYTGIRYATFVLPLAAFWLAVTTITKSK